MIRAWLDQELNSMQVQTDHSIQPSPTTLPRQDNEPALIHIPEVHRHFPFFLSTRHKSPTKLAARVSALSMVCESFRLRVINDQQGSSVRRPPGHPHSSPRRPPAFRTGSPSRSLHGNIILSVIQVLHCIYTGYQFEASTSLILSFISLTSLR